MHTKKAILMSAVLFFAILCSITTKGEPVYFLVAEANQVNPVNGDSYVLPLAEPNDIAHARNLIEYGVGAGQPIAVANIMCGPACINRNYLASDKPKWSWHITAFDHFADSTPSSLNGTPTLVNNNCWGWMSTSGGQIGFWDYTVIAELGINPKHWQCDFDDDDDVDFADYAPVGNNWMAGCTSPDWCGGTDINRSGAVDLDDLRIFAESWLSPYAATPTVTSDPVWSTAWDWPYQCYGDADNATETFSKYRVYTNDFAVWQDVYSHKNQCGWPCYYPNFYYDARVDFDRDLNVYDDDYSIMNANYKKKDSDFSHICSRAESSCPRTTLP